MAVFDTMRYVKSDVSTVCVGLAASMGAFILASGQKVGLAPCCVHAAVEVVACRRDFIAYVLGSLAALNTFWGLSLH